MRSKASNSMTMLLQTGASFAVLLFYLVSVGNAFHLQSFINIRLQKQLHAVSFREQDEQHVSDTSLHEFTSVDRRTALTWACAAVTGASVWNPSSAFADSATTLAPITHKVFMDVRISRSDGTFYVRDDLPDIQENKVFYGRLVLGLFGTKAPTAVDRFLSYVVVPFNPLDDNPLPSYGRSSFKSLDQSTGKGGSILLQ
jgi:hypothetical protein